MLHLFNVADNGLQLLAVGDTTQETGRSEFRAAAV